MANCECLEGCIFFHDRMAQKPAMAEVYKQKYCLTDNSQCARHMVFRRLGKGTVPADLYPNQVERAAELLKGK